MAPYSGAVLSVEEIEDILSVGHETQGFEFKGPGGRTDSYFFAKITRAALSLGNLRDGGYIIIGVSDENPGALQPGLDESQLASWTDYDSVARKLAVYADPPLRFEVQGVTLSTGAWGAVIRVYEFEDVPHVCAKAYENVLRQGALYVRPRKVPETSELASSIEMRDVLDLAIEKGVRRFAQVAARAGLPLGGSGSARGGPSDEELYDNERAEAWS
jgi:predicted HTH transcriptional regulator